MRSVIAADSSNAASTTSLWKCTTTVMKFEVRKPSCLTLVLVLSLVVSCPACPDDIIQQVSQCFNDLASGVTSGSATSLRGSIESMPLDYSKIREYCKEGGHMSRFLSCVDELVQQCENEEKGNVLLQFINPDRVRSSVPNLCNNVDVLEASASCLKNQMQQQSACKEQAHEMVNRGMVETPGNATAMFIVQCRFFNILAECQRKSVSENCGSNLGDLHADFLLSFVPNTCSTKNLYKPNAGEHPRQPITTKPSPNPSPRSRHEHGHGLKDGLKTLPPDIMDVQSNKMSSRSLKNETTSGADMTHSGIALSLTIVVISLYQ